MPQGSQQPRVERRFFVVGCAFTAIALALAIWAFAIGALSGDQRILVRILLSVAVGFAAGSFVGSLSIESKRLAPGLITTATGGFGVWVLLFWFWPAGTTTGSFFVTIRPHGEHGDMDIVCKGATITIDLDGDRRGEPVSSKGEARFDGIPAALDGRKVNTSIECPGYSIAGDSRIGLARDSAVYLALIATHEASPAPPPVNQGPPPDCCVDAPPDVRHSDSSKDASRRCAQLSDQLARLNADFPDPCTLERYPLEDDRKSCNEKDSIRDRASEAGCR